jgi:two-component system, cell cycle response regulator DivK
MSSPFSSAELAHIRDDARHMVEGIRDHRCHLDGLVQTAEGVARQANLLSVALAHADVDLHELQRLCSDQVHRTAENAKATVRACVSAREQQVTAHRLHTRIGYDSEDLDELAASRPTAVLVVDDVQDVRELVAIVLRNAGFAVRTAVNGLEALLTAYEMRPAVIVMDLEMPVLNGIEATRLIKASEATRESRVIAYTGNGSISPPSDRWFVAVVPKPSPPNAVLEAVQHACRL